MIVYQNNMADAASPCGDALAALCHSLGARLSHHRTRTQWPTPSAAAWCLRRVSAGPRAAPEEMLDYLAGKGKTERSAVEVYAHRLGVIGPEGVKEVATALEAIHGERPSFAELDECVAGHRAALWSSAVAAFRAAHAARSWALTADPEQAVQHTEQDKLAQWRHERRRAHARGQLPRSRRQKRRRREVQRKRKNKKQVAKRAGQKSSREGQVGAESGVRRTKRRNAGKPGRSPWLAAFHWNRLDEYVLAYDEVGARATNARRDIVSADRSKKWASSLLKLCSGG